MGVYGLSDEQCQALQSSLKNNELLKGIMKDLQDSAFTKWITHAPETQEGIQAWYEYQGVEAFKTLLSNAYTPATETQEEEE